MLTASAVGVAAALLFLAPLSASADNGGDGPSKGSTVQFSAVGTSGTESPGPNSTGNPCQQGGTCEVITNGSALVSAGSYVFPATYVSDLYIDYSGAYQTTLGSFCAPATGTVTITSQLNPDDQIFKSETGLVCGGDSAGATHTFNGTYEITGGAGRFSGASGSGTVTAADDGLGTVTASQESGTISYPGARGHGEGDDNGGGDDNGNGQD